MPLELIVIVFVVIAFVAIIARFLPRDAAGRRHLPRIVDESVGMYVLRRSLGRPTEAASDLAKAEVDPTATVSEDEIAYRIGVAGAPEPTIPTRFVVSQGQPQAHPIPPVVPIATRPVVGGRPQARRRGAALVPFQRRIAALGTLAAILLVGFAALSLPRAPEEAVLSATGTPGATPATSELAFVPTPSPTEAPPASESTSPTSSASPTASPTPDSAVATPPPAVATQALTPTATPRRTAPPTPRPTPRPTPPPTPSPTPAPTPPPTPPPSPTPTPAPPAASFDGSCDAGSLTVTFTGDDGVGSPSSTYDWTFGDASSGSGKVVSHTYGSGGTYLVTLTVTNPGGASSAQQNVTVPC